jgi:hypothetical protein
MAIGGASTLTTAIFWGAFQLGRLQSRIDDAHKSIVELGNRMDRAGDRMSDLADKVQTFPEHYLTRAEALNWRGSRAEDPKRVT